MAMAPALTALNADSAILFASPPKSWTCTGVPLGVRELFKFGNMFFKTCKEGTPVKYKGFRHTIIIGSGIG